MTPLKFMTARVLVRRMVTPGMVRVTLGGEGMADMRTTGIGDEYIRLFFPDLETGELNLPMIDERGHWRYEEGKVPAHSECYTIRKVRDGEIDVDFVVHAHGRASEWAQQASPGDVITIREPHAIYKGPADLQWLLLVADATGLPALGRLLEGLPASVEVCAIIEVADTSHEQQFETVAKLKTIWLHSGNGLSASQLEHAVRAVSVPVNRKTYVWVAGETKASRGIRKYLRHELKWPGDRYSVTAYWSETQAEWTTNWESLDPAIKAKVEALWDSGRDQEEVADEVEAVLEPFGL